jgi:hypothetical protein
MPTLAQSLHAHDLGHLRIVAEHWGIDLKAPDARTALAELTSALLNEELVAEIVGAFSDEGQAALNMLIQNEGQVPWPQFTRRFGEVRAVGPGRRDRERPDRHPISASEELWYRALIGRAFFDTPSGAQEFAYIPNDLLPLIPAAPQKETPSETSKGQPLLGRAATPEERAHPILADDRLLDHVCTLLAAHRLQIDPASQFPDPENPDAPTPLLIFATTLLGTAHLLDPTGFPELENARAHLEASRGEALLQLAQSWLRSADHNDLHHVPHLQAEGEWHNDALGTRRFLVGLLQVVPADTWWSISAFLADLHRDFPDFQRPASDYDSWIIRDTRTDKFLRGFEHWDDVDGALIRYLITGPLHWLGILDLAIPEEETAPEDATGFRISKWAAFLWDSAAPPPKFPPEDAPIHVRSDGRVSIPFLTSRAARYQIARFCHWESPTSHEYRYRFTPGSLDQAIDQGLKIQHLQTLLARHAQNVPPNIVKVLDRWDQRGTEARLQSVLILRLSSPELLKAVRNSRAARYLGEPLGPTTVIVKPGAGEKVLEVLTEMGYLGEIIE